MKIAYIYPAFTNIGGADKIIISKANYMADHWGWEGSQTFSGDSKHVGI